MILSLAYCEICQISLEKFHMIDLGNEVQSYSISFQNEKRINAYYRVYNFFGDCFVNSNSLCENGNMNYETDALLIHNEYFLILNDTLEFKTLCNMTYPNLICENKSLGDKYIYTRRILILENIFEENLKINFDISKTNFEIKVALCEDYKENKIENNPFSWLQNTSFMIAGFSIALICCVICCIFKLCFRILKCISDRI